MLDRSQVTAGNVRAPASVDTVYIKWLPVTVPQIYVAAKLQGVVEMQAFQVISDLVLVCSLCYTSSSMKFQSSGDGNVKIPSIGTSIYFSFITDSSESAVAANSSNLAAMRLAFTVNLALFEINQIFSGYSLKYTTMLDSEVRIARVF